MPSNQPINHIEPFPLHDNALYESWANHGRMVPTTPVSVGSPASGQNAPKFGPEPGIVFGL